MSFRTITQGCIPNMQDGMGYEIYFSPCPPADVLPTAWLDLHVAEDGYHDCGYERGREFKISQDKRKYVRIRPHRAIRVSTAETVGLDCNHIAIITNAAGKAKHGLIVATGKVDPGFARNRLTIVVYNQAERAVDLFAGDKIACIAFARISEVAKATNSLGHGGSLYPYYAPSVRERLRRWYELHIQPQWGMFIVRVVVTLIGYLIAALGGAYLVLKRLGS
jgi:dUTPase